MEIITLREFARRIGVSLTAIQKGVQNGRIEAIKDATTGRITGIDWDTQAEAWQANSKHPQKRPRTLSGGRPRNDGAPPAPPAPRSAPQPTEPRVAIHLGGQAHGGALLRSERVEPATALDQMSLAEIQRARELVKLQIDEAKLQEATGRLISREEVKQQAFRTARSARDALMTMEDRLSPILASTSDIQEVRKVLRDDIRRTCERLAADIEGI